MQKDRWSRKYDWIKSGNAYYQENRLEKYNQDRFIAVGDIYFKLNKYLTGVTFSYINNLYDIYKRDLLTGDGYSIVNMYNEYDVIDRAMKNIVFVDVASSTNVDLTKQWNKIDNVQLRPGHLVLLYNQDSEFQNDIYKVSPQYFLINAGLLSTREKADKFSCSIKLGNHADKQYFLINNGFDFPMYNEPKYFIEGKSFLLKNLIKYNLYNTSSNSAITSKIIFTDYDFARKQLVNNYNLFTECTLNLSATTVTNNYFKLTYHHDEYAIRTGTTNSSVGPVSAITNSTYASGSIVPFDSNVDIRVGDHVQIKIFSVSGTNTTEYLTMKTYVKGVNDLSQYLIDGGTSSISGSSTLDCEYSTGSTITLTLDGGSTYLVINNYLVLEESIPTNILRDLKNYYFEIKDLNIATSWGEAINFLQYTKFIDFYTMSGTTTYLDGGTSFIPFDSTLDGGPSDSVEDEFLDGGDSSVALGTITFYPRESKYDKYFDYDGLRFFTDDDTINTDFITNIHYIKYKLYERLNQINSNFTSNYSIFNSYSLSVTDFKYTDNNRIRITSTLTGLTNIFKPYTYVDLTALGEPSGRTLVYSVSDFEIVVEKPFVWSSYPTDSQLPAVLTVQNIDGLQNISEILYEVYLNVDYDWYILKSENERKYICKSYADLLTQNEYFRDNVTGILYENDKNEFVLNLYDLERDRQLSYSPIDLVFVGGDRKSRMPVPLKMASGITSTYVSTWNVLDGGLDDPLYSEDVFDFGFNNVLGGPNTPAPIYTLIDGNA